MKQKLGLIISIVYGVLIIGCLPALAIPAFPGAEGFGANSVGGRGGTVIKVTNLNDSGPGSFRAAVTAEGPRVIVFTVSGIINLQSSINILQPYITIAGETSPGGVCIAGYCVTLGAHDIIIRHMRFRVGSHRISDGSNADPESLDSLDIWGNTVPGGGWEGNNIIIDHCSVSWGVDETFSISYNAQNITVSWSIISEGLSQAGHPKGEHSKGLFVSGKSGTPTVTLHHNYIAHNHDRNPLIGSGTAAPRADVVNNVIYNWYHMLGAMSQNIAEVNWIHNYFKKGPNSIGYPVYEALHYTNEPLYPMAPMIYMEGNLGLRRTVQTDPEWQVGTGYTDVLLNEGYRQLTRYNAPPVTTPTMSYDVAKCILTGVGATAPVRDSVDTRVIDDFFAGTGTIPLNVTFPDDYPVYQNVSPPADLDNDGMSDEWEVARGLNPSVNDSALKRYHDGYTNIEHYLHDLSYKSYAHNLLCMPMEAPLIKVIKIL